MGNKRRIKHWTRTKVWYRANKALWTINNKVSSQNYNDVPITKGPNLYKDTWIHQKETNGDMMNHQTHQTGRNNTWSELMNQTYLKKLKSYWMCVHLIKNLEWEPKVQISLVVQGDKQDPTILSDPSLLYQNHSFGSYYLATIKNMRIFTWIWSTYLHAKLTHIYVALPW